jgi:hypothetical protein
VKKYSKEFTISTAEQRSPQWFAERCGKPSASGLAFLFDTLKDGYTPSAKAKNYLKQLAYERKFGTTFEIFQTKAMADGVFFEDFAKMVYEREAGNILSVATSFVSDWFVATPDARVFDVKIKQHGGLECKVVGDKTFMAMMEEGAPIEHERQTQSQMMASGWDWVDYIVVNLKTRAYFIQRVHRNNVLIKRIYERLHEPLDLPILKDIGVKRFEEDLLQSFMTGNNLKEEDLIIPDLGF